MNASVVVRPHDLLWGLPVPDDAPLWVAKALRLGQPVVVRRAMTAADQVAVGVRGPLREHRYATLMWLSDIQRCVQPEQLIDLPPGADWPALRVLRQVRPFMEDLGLVWGVSGSAGFELASGFAALHQGSDLDLILRTPSSFSRRQAFRLAASLSVLTELSGCRIDVQLQTPQGGVGLGEWAGSSRRVLLKTAEGARLIADPWSLTEQAA
ncbi:malonate decarboxylase holo-ACP synthase [Pseudomonas sp. NA-150]|uniref:malonate decarboxylase holo-ACP synthase n=1 Tax=Pseudomonas sp. NA-150 TaxID=3367525 RepID=UPI0037C8A51F